MTTPPHPNASFFAIFLFLVAGVVHIFSLSFLVYTPPSLASPPAAGAREAQEGPEILRQGHLGQDGQDHQGNTLRHTYVLIFEVGAIGRCERAFCATDYIRLFFVFRTIISTRRRESRLATYVLLYARSTESMYAVSKTKAKELLKHGHGPMDRPAGPQSLNRPLILPFGGNWLASEP